MDQGQWGSFSEGETRSRLGRAAAALLTIATVAISPNAAVADEGGVSFWVPGLFGSLAATPQTPGFSLATIYYHTSVKAGSDVAFARQVSRGNITVPFTANVDINLKARADLGFVIPSYVFAEKIFGAQAAISTLIVVGRNRVEVDGTLTAAVGPIGFTVGGSRSDAVTGFGDLYPMFTLKWNEGVHNYIAYVTGDIPVGSYDKNRLANLGIGHGAFDAGGGYTYFNPQTGYEFSSVVGLTYNFMNNDTQYQSGIDMHWDWGASRFVNPEWQIGLVGYAYQQLSCDSGSGDRVGCFRSRVIGIGPQIGHVFKISDGYKGYVNLKGYGEFAAAHRPEGWNVWLTFAISSAAPEPAAPPTRRIVK
jgi:hypothetical protein